MASRLRLASIPMASFIMTPPLSPCASLHRAVRVSRSTVFVTGEPLPHYSDNSPARLAPDFQRCNPRRLVRSAPADDESSFKTNQRSSVTTMRRRRNDYDSWQSSSSPKRRKRFDEGITRFSDVMRTARSAWQDASASNRLLATTLLIGGLSLTAAAVNLVLHISFIFAFALVPLLLMPLLFSVIAGLGIFAFLATATAGAGFMFLGTPLFMISVAFKALTPVLIAAFVLNLVVSTGLKMFGVNRTDNTDRNTRHNNNVTGMHQEVEDVRDDVNDQLRDFDRMLRNRTTTSQTERWDDNVNEWSLDDVIDELDACGLGRYRQLFIDERIDGNTLLTLTDAEIRAEFSDSMPLGDRRRLSRLVSSLRTRASKYR